MSIYLGEQLVGSVGGAGNSTNPVKPSDFIDDTLNSTEKAYSSTQTEKRLNEVQNTIQNRQDSMVKMWQRSVVSAKINGTTNFTTSEDHTLDKLQIQGYKFIEGEIGIVETIKNFDNGDETSFYYSDDVDFNGVMKVKDEHPLGKTLTNDGYYETGIINKEEFLELHNMEVY